MEMLPPFPGAWCEPPTGSNRHYVGFLPLGSSHQHHDAMDLTVIETSMVTPSGDRVWFSGLGWEVFAFIYGPTLQRMAVERVVLFGGTVSWPLIGTYALP